MKYLFSFLVAFTLFTSCTDTPEGNEEETLETPASEEDNYAHLEKEIDPPNALYEDTTIEIHNFDEFYTHLGSNRTLLLDMKEMSLPQTLKEGGSNLNVELNYGLIINGLSNLRIMARKDQVHIIQPDPTYKIFTFTKCENIILENIKAGHSPQKGGCSASVLAFENSNNIFLRDCQLYGSGYEAITAYEAGNVACRNVEMYDCSYRILSLSRSNKFQFRDCTFRDNKENGSGSFYLFNTDDVSFIGGSIRDNARWGEDVPKENPQDMPLFLLDDCEDILFKDISVTNNKALIFASDTKIIYKSGVKEEGNYWQKENTAL